MSTIQFVYSPGTTFTANVAATTISNGSFGISNQNSISFAGTFVFSELAVSSGQISFKNMSWGVTASGNISIPVTAAGGDPVITVTGFTGTVWVNWNAGSANIQPGVPLTLSNFQN